MGSHALQFDSVRFTYPGSSEQILDIPQLDVPVGQFVSLLGASGSGKSTLLRLVAELLSPTHGSVTGRDDQIGMVFQSPNLVPWRTAEGNVRLPAELGSTRTNVSTEQIEQLFGLVGFQKDDVRKRPAELSGGMQMRVALARALVLQPSMLLLDEPFAALDDVLRMQLEQDVRRIHDEQSLTTVLVTHNIHEAVFMSDRVLVLGGSPSTIHADITVRLGITRDPSTRTAAEYHKAVNEISQQLQQAATMVAS